MQWLLTTHVPTPHTEAKELRAIRRSVERGAPFGGQAWVEATNGQAR